MKCTVASSSLPCIFWGKGAERLMDQLMVMSRSGGLGPVVSMFSSFL